MQGKDVSKEVLENLIEKSFAVKEKSYSPYSKFRVGAALLCKDGTIFTGCNVENACYSPTICAERTAVVKAVSYGHQQFTAIVIASDLEKEFIYPCGQCRQTLSEFSSDMDIYMTKTDKSYQKQNIRDLLPGNLKLQDSLVTAFARK